MLAGDKVRGKDGKRSPAGVYEGIVIKRKKVKDASRSVVIPL
jgi:hypothetical protein